MREEARRVTLTRRAYHRGRYGTWVIACEDYEAVLDGGTVYSCRSCDVWHHRKRSRFCSVECRDLWHKLVEAPLWFDGVRVAALVKARKACVNCGRKEGSSSPDSGGARTVLEVDHVRPVREFPELEFDAENLRVLCRDCHARLGWRPGRIQPSVGFNESLDKFVGVSTVGR